MKYRAMLLTVASIPAILLATACAPVEPPPQDPTKEQIILLQKQLLELQKVQNETKQKLDESITNVDIKLKSLEEGGVVQPSAEAAPQPQIEPKPAETKQIQPEKKPTPKPAKKKKKILKKKKKKPIKKVQPVRKEPQ